MTVSLNNLRLKSHLRIAVLLSLTLLSKSVFAYQVKDSYGKYYLDRPPTRVVVTDWTLLEQLLELGITPVGAPELSLYEAYVKQPALPNDVKDIGLRRAPDLDILKALAPEAIIIGTDQKKLALLFSRFTKVFFYQSFSDKYRTNGTKSRLRFLQIADLFQKRTLAEKKLEAMDLELTEIKAQIARHFKARLPRLTLIRFSGIDTCLVYGANSMAQHTLEQLGLENAAEFGRSKWGEREIPLAQLDELNSDVILYIEPFTKLSDLESSRQWQSLSVVQQSQVYPMKEVWSYGGAMSVLYKARAIRDVLITLPRDGVTRVKTTKLSVISDTTAFDSEGF
jgi:iron complex transport system substrate-binding protein